MLLFQNRRATTIQGGPLWANKCLNPMSILANAFGRPRAQAFVIVKNQRGARRPGSKAVGQQPAMRSPRNEIKSEKLHL